MEDQELIDKRKEQILTFARVKTSWIFYAILAVIVYISVKIRTANLPLLRDVTNSSWALGPDLDPWLFTRWAKYIVENGSLFAVDPMRYVPIGFDIKRELILHPYLIAWFHNIATWFGSESVVQSAAIFPVFMFALTVPAFFFLVRKIFIKKLGVNKASIIALASSFFFTVLPALLPRTIAGIPEKESAAFFFMFLAFYFFLSSWQSEKPKISYFLALLAGISTAAMALVWGGFVFIFITIGLAMLIAFILGKVERKEFYLYGIWLFSASIIMSFFSTRYPLTSLLSSTNQAIALLPFVAILVHIGLFKTKIGNRFSHGFLSKIPKQIISLIVTGILGVLVTSVLIKPLFFIDKIVGIKNTLVTPTTNRFAVTVAENRQPFFTEWASNFGPAFNGIPIVFWLFFIGSIYLFYKMVYLFDKKERLILTGSYTIFLIAIVFSRYAPGSSLNGTNMASLFLYAIGFIALIGCSAFYYYKYHKKGVESELNRIDFSFILVFTFFFLTIISARGAVRLIMMLVPPASIIASYFIVQFYSDARKITSPNLKIVATIIAAVFIVSAVFAGYQNYKIVDSEASNFGLSVYNQQWQYAMSWVRENTDKNSVFGHWWDYGYWVQSIGERATVLDGGNAVGYWNYFMGRHALTGADNQLALEFLYAHNTTHFLIDSTDIGKYGAFSSIGSDKNFDRASFMPALVKNNQATRESKDSIVYVYPGGFSTDEDIIHKQDGEEIFLPGGKTGVGAVLVERDRSGKLLQPSAIFVYQSQQITLPLRYAFDSELHDFGSGLESGIYIFPRINPTAQSFQVEEDGALLYLSKRTVKSQLARLYLYNENNPNFRLAHSQDDFIVQQIKNQRPDFNFDIIYFQGLRGPIKIWEISYPSNIQFKKEFLDTIYPQELQTT